MALKESQMLWGEMLGEALRSKNSVAKEAKAEEKTGSKRRELLKRHLEDLVWGGNRSRSTTIGAWSEITIDSIEEERRF